MSDMPRDPAIPIADFRKAVADAADMAGKLWLSEIGVLFYTGLAAAGVTHVDLLKENGVKLPFLSIELSLISFFFLGPIIVLLAHAYVLHHLTILAGKTEKLLRAIDGSPTRDDELVLLPISLFVQILIGPRANSRTPYWIATVVAWATLVLGPVCLLAFMQLQFLPYHDQALTWWGRATVLIDLGLVWWLWPQVSRIPAIGWRGLQATGMRVFTVVAIYLVVAVATFPGEWLDTALPEFPLHATLVGGQYDGETHASNTIWSNRLFVAGVTLIDLDKYDTPDKRAAAPPSKSLRGRHLEYAVLTEAQLGRVDLTDAYLEGASLLRVHAEGAWFDRADLSGAQLDQAELEGASFYRSRMEGATLADADLQGAALASADLRAAWLPGAHLDGASMASADLQRATLDQAILVGASLNDTNFQGASLVETELEGASFLRARLWKADFSRALVGSFLQKPDPSDTGDDLCATDTCDAIRKMIERDVPDTATRARMLARLWLQLDPHKTEIWEQAKDALLKLPPVADEEAKRAEIWSRIACAGKGAPYVLQMLVDTYIDAVGWTRPLKMPATATMVKAILAQPPAACAADLAIGPKLKMDLMDLKRIDRPEQPATPAPATPAAALTTPDLPSRRRG